MFPVRVRSMKLSSMAQRSRQLRWISAAVSVRSVVTRHWKRTSPSGYRSRMTMPCKGTVHASQVLQVGELGTSCARAGALPRNLGDDAGVQTASVQARQTEHVLIEDHVPRAGPMTVSMPSCFRSLIQPPSMKPRSTNRRLMVPFRPGLLRCGDQQLALRQIAVFAEAAPR